MNDFLTQIKADLTYLITEANEFGDDHTIGSTSVKAIMHASGYSRDSKVLSGVDEAGSVSLIVMDADYARPPVDSILTVDSVDYHVIEVKNQGVGAWRATLERYEG